LTRGATLGEHRRVEAAPVFDAEQEVRFAVVLYGGASLAIYMYGIAEEFLRLVRSTAPAERVADTGMAGPLAYPEPESTEAVYRKLGQLLPFGPGSSSGGRVRTRFVVDVISGTSAGGINGVCLAKALANGTSLAGLKRLWLNDGDIGVLVNDRRSAYEDDAMRQLVEGLSADVEAKSLLNADRMLMRLITAFGQMDAPAPDTIPPLVDELDLWVTATDLDGKKLPIQLWNGVVSERRFANRYHFRVSARDARNDFRRADNPFLAFAARCTSAFPFAFEAMRLRHLQDFPNAVPADPSWARFYAAYKRDEFPARPFSDGGILDNKPFSYATGSLVSRRAPLPVDRKLVFVEPDPSTGTGEAPEKAWNGLQTAEAALLTLPRAENIRGDIQTVLTRNRTIERAREILAQAAADAPDRERIAGMLADELDSEAWAGLSLAETIAHRNWGPSYASYHRLKVRGLVDYLASLVVRAKGLDPDSDAFLAVHYLVRAWKDARYAETPAPGVASENELLRDFSLPYRWRRLDYVLKRQRELHSDDVDVVARALTGAGLPPGLPAGADGDAIFLELRRGLTLAEDELYAADRALAGRDGLVATLNLDAGQIASIIATPDDRAMQARAAAVLAEVGADAFAAVTAQVAETIRAASQRSRTRVDELLGPPVTERDAAAATDLRSALTYALRFYYDAFEWFDAILYPLEFGTDVGETNPIEIRRISPLECNHPLAARPESRVLRGTAISHFGAFFERDWRTHDMLWGRLNASESLIRALVPEEHPDFEALIDEAHRVIVSEFAADQEPPVPPERSWDWFLTEYAPRAEPQREPTLAILDRAAVVLGKVVGGAVPAKVAPGWKLVASVLRPNPGGLPAVAHVVRELFLRTVPGIVALVAWLALVVAGIALIATDANLALGIVLLVVAVLLAGALLVGLWLAIAKLRAALDRRVGAFVFGRR
jgi:patatin-related protein